MPKGDIVLGSQERGGPDRRLDLINPAKGVDRQEAKFRHRLQAQQEAQDVRKLSEELTLELMKVSRIAIAGHVGHEDISQPTVQKTKKEVYVV